MSGTVHRCPADGEILMPCCCRTPLEIAGSSDRLTVDDRLVTCPARPPAWTIPAEFVSGKVGEWVEVIRLDQLRATFAQVASYLREFHETYGVPIRTTPTANPPESDLRTRLLAEEVQEYYDAVEAGDVVEVADALADIVYVAYGSALSHGIDLDAVLAEVHRSNMSKLGADGKPILREDGKVIKGPGYFRPDIARVIGVSR